MKRNVKLIAILLLVLGSKCLFAQDEATEEEDKLTKDKSGLKGFHIGFFAGAYFANNYTAKVYDGYGVNLAGETNDFAHSYMNQKINIETGKVPPIGYPGYGWSPSDYTDYVGQSFTPPRDRDQWNFGESDMPLDMKYYTGFLFGIQTNYGLTKKEALILNMNFVNLALTGTFTITTKFDPSKTQYQDTVHYYGIKGTEQRLLFQIGYQRVVTNGDQLNFFIEGGLCANYAHLQTNTIDINGYTINLLERFEDPNYLLYQPEHYVGWGVGAFGGFGVNIGVTSKYIMQFVYNASYETVDLGHQTEPHLQQSVGLRAYYNL